MASEDALIALATAISDGVPVDWDAAESSAATAQDAAIVRSLRRLATLGGVHRTEVDDGTAPASGVLGQLQSARALPHWGHLALVEPLGSGTQGEVFRAIDTRLDREVALKFLRRRVDATNATQVLGEPRLLARVRHPNVVTVYGADLIDGRVGLWMELIKGQTLDTIVARDGPMNGLEASLVGLDMCRALGAVHAAGLLHRDIKAQNVMRESGGRYVLMDFGAGHELANAAGHDRRTGTPLYLAPEVLAGQPASARSDIYALGVLLFHLATGGYPVSAWSVPELIEAHAREDRKRIGDVRGGLSAGFRDVVQRATDPDPAKRFATAAEMEEALRQAIGLVTATSATRARWRWGAAAVAAAAVLIAAVSLWPRAPAVPAGRLVAVLPFQDLSADQSLRYVAEGMSDLLITDLGQSAGAKVLARTSTAAFVGPRGVADVAREFNVGAVIEGAITREGDRLRTTVRIVDPSTGSMIWSRYFVHRLDELGSIERDVVKLAATELRLNVNEQQLARQYQGLDGAAFETYFRAWSEYYRLNRAGMHEAQRLFRELTERQPSFAPAHAALGQSTLMLATSYAETDPPFDVAVREATASVERARALDPTNSYAAAVAGWIRYLAHWDWAGAEAHFLHALALNPSDAYARGLYAQLLMLLNRLDPALIEARRAQQLDPFNRSRAAAVSICLYYLQRTDEAIAEAQRLLARDPSAHIAHLALARYYSAEGKHDEAITIMQTGASLTEPPVQAELARVYAAAGRRADAEALLPGLTQAYRGGRLAPDYLAYVHLALGDRRRSLELLHEAVRHRSTSVFWIGVDPRFDDLRNDLEFMALLKALGLAS
jgi:TolB-like protein